MATTASPRKAAARTRLRLVAALAALVALATVAAAVSGCGATSTVDPVAQAATLTGQTSGTDATMNIAITVPNTGQSVTLPGTGYFDMRGRRGELTFDLSKLSALAGGRLGSGAQAKMQEIYVYPDIYVGSPALAKSIPGGKKWLKVNVQQAARQVLGGDPSSLTSQQSPSDSLRNLRAVSNLQRVGTETIRGVQTTHYRGTVDLHKLPKLVPPSERAATSQQVNTLISRTGASSYPVDVWVDAQKLVRRMHLAYSMKIPSAGATEHVSFAMTMDLFNFGVKRAVVPPPASDVFDASGLLGRAQAGSTAAP